MDKNGLFGFGLERNEILSNHVDNFPLAKAGQYAA